MNQEIIKEELPRCYVAYELDGVARFSVGGAGVPFARVAAFLPEGAANIREVSEETFLQAQSPQETAQQRLLRDFTDRVQRRLDDFARTKTYDNMLSACTYAASTNPAFRREGQYCVQARDATWEAANAVMQAVLEGERSIPTWEELEAELPPLNWPDAE